MDVLLVTPPRVVPQRGDFPPLGLAYLCAVLKKAQIDATVLDASALSWKRVAERLRTLSPRIVGISCWTIERSQSFRLGTLVSEILPDAKIIFGGHHATAFPEHMFIQGLADAVVIGEGEDTIVDLTRRLLDGDSLALVHGIVYREGSHTHRTAPRTVNMDLDSIPYPSYSDINLDDYLGFPEARGRTTSLISSRGCPHNCTFCSAPVFWKRRWRARSAENVLGEIQWLYDVHGVRNLSIFDDNFTVLNERAIEICKGILDRGLRIRWTASSHVNHIRKPMLDWMKKAGCIRIDFGVESGSPKVLKNVMKGATVAKITEAFRLVHEAGINPKAYLMVGNPGEDEQSIDDTIELMRRIRPYSSDTGGILWVLPDTGIYEIAKRQGLIDDAFWLENRDVIYYTGEHTLEELKALKHRLMRGMARNRGSVKAMVEFCARRVYYRWSAFQKLRGLRYLFK